MKKDFEPPKVPAAEVPDPLYAFPRNVNLYKESYTIAEFASVLIEQGGIVIKKDVNSKNSLHNFQKRVGFYVKEAGAGTEASERVRTKETRDSREIMQKSLNDKRFVKFLQDKALISHKEVEKQRKREVDKINKSERKLDLEYQLEQEKMPPDGNEYDRPDIEDLFNAHSLQAQEDEKEMDTEAVAAAEADQLLKYQWDIVFDVVFKHLINFDSAKLKSHMKLKRSAEEKRYDKTADELDAISALERPESYYQLKPELQYITKASSDILTKVDELAKQKKKELAKQKKKGK